MRRALEKIMERQTEIEGNFPPFVQKLIDRGELKGKLENQRATLLRLMGRVGIAVGEEERARIEACTDTATLDRWLDNVLVAKTASDVLT